MATQLVKVLPYSGAKYDYGFRTKNFLTDLGHEQIALGTAPTKPIVIGANNVKPLRAKKKTASGYTSSFVSNGALDGAVTAGYSIVAGRGAKRYKGSTLSKRVAVKVHTNLYLGWLMKTSTYTKLGADGRTALGIVDAETVPADELVFGAQAVILPTAVEGIPAGQVVSLKFFEAGYVLPDGKTVKTKKKPADAPAA